MDYWEIEVRHEGLNKYRHIRGSDKYIVEQKAVAQQRTWDEMWQKKERKELAITKTEEAQAAIDELENVLHHTLSIDSVIDWDSLLDKSSFSEKNPSEPMLVECPQEPKKIRREISAQYC